MDPPAEKISFALFGFLVPSVPVYIWTRRELNPELISASEVFYRWTTGPKKYQIFLIFIFTGAYRARFIF